jgi:hypothetical protein
MPMKIFSDIFTDAISCSARSDNGYLHWNEKLPDARPKKLILILTQLFAHW